MLLKDNSNSDIINSNSKIIVLVLFYHLQDKLQVIGNVGRLFTYIEVGILFLTDNTIGIIGHIDIMFTNI